MKKWNKNTFIIRWSLALFGAFVFFGPGTANAQEPASEEAFEEAYEEEASQSEALYVENEWNYVEESMDISGGIPEDAQGRLARIRELGKLKVATEPYFAPQEFIDPSLPGQAQYVGADMELARLVAERMGVELEIVPMDFTKVLEAAEEGSCDLAISGLSYTPGRAGVMELSKGYHFSEGGTATGLLIRKEDKKEIIDVASLAEKELVAQSGSLQEMLLAENVSHYRQFRRVGSVAELMEAVRSKKADAAAVDLETARVYLKTEEAKDLTLVEGVAFTLEEQFEGDRIAGPKGELQLMYFVNGIIDEVLNSGQYEAWFEEYAAYAARLGL